jgi:hypothetical protein
VRYAVAHLSEIPGVPDPDPGDPDWKPIRHHLGLRSFGVNAFVAPEAGGRLVDEHSELESGHEELYLVLAGEATFTIEGEEHACPAGTAVAILDPAVVRKAVAKVPGTTVLALGATPGRSYEVTQWDRKWTSGLPQASS